jgi:hypothetical protein
LKCEKFTDDRRQTTDDRRQTTDDGRQVMAIVHMDLWSRWTKNVVLYEIYSVKSRVTNTYVHWLHTENHWCWKSTCLHWYNSRTTCTELCLWPIPNKLVTRYMIYPLKYSNHPPIGHSHQRSLLLSSHWYSYITNKMLLFCPPEERPPL